MGIPRRFLLFPELDHLSMGHVARGIEFLYSLFASPSVLDEVWSEGVVQFAILHALSVFRRVDGGKVNHFAGMDDLYQPGCFRYRK
jgi:hypothetical protein